MLANSLAVVVAEEAAKRLLLDMNLEHRPKRADRRGFFVAKCLALVQADTWAKREVEGDIYKLDELREPAQVSTLSSLEKLVGETANSPGGLRCQACNIYSALRQLTLWSKTPCFPRPSSRDVISSFSAKKRQHSMAFSSDLTDDSSVSHRAVIILIVQRLLMSPIVSPRSSSGCTVFSSICSWKTGSHVSVAFLSLLCCSFSVSFFSMAEESIWTSAQIPHPFKSGTYVQDLWLEARQPGVVGATPRRNSRGWRSSSDEDERCSGGHFATPWVPSRSHPSPPPDERVPTTPTVQLPPGIQLPPNSDADASLLGFRQVDCSLRLRIDEALSTYGDDDEDWRDAWRTHQPCSSSRRATLISQLYNDCEPAPEFLDRSPGRSPGPALKSDRSKQILSWNPGLASGSDLSLLASLLNGPWHVIFVQELSGFVTDSSLAENFHVVTQHHCAVLLNNDTFKYDISCTPFQIPCSLRYATWAV